MPGRICPLYYSSGKAEVTGRKEGDSDMKTENIDQATVPTVCVMDTEDNDETEIGSEISPPDNQAESSDNVNWHRLWGLMVSSVFEELGCETTVEMDLSMKSQFLDMVVVTRDRPPRYDRLPPAYYEGFENLNEHNLISFKSFHESFNRTALEEFYGHFTNYRKMRKIEEKDKGKVSLYAVTHHFPRDLFSAYQGTEFLECVREGNIYTLRPGATTQVRFIITHNLSHPILGLFSDSPDQVAVSRRQMESDDWPVRNISSYLGELYKHYLLEGIDMPYTQEMFIRDYEPEWYEKIQAARNVGRKEGEIIGKIQFLQQLLDREVLSSEELRDRDTGELEKFFHRLRTEFEQRGGHRKT